jgi:ABC-type Na+ efflux pump permease subunit
VSAAYSAVGEREQGTLEPLLTTPLRREELLLGKALGVVVPAVGIAYLLFGLIERCAKLFASNAAVVSALRQGPHILAEILFAPLLAGWSIWVGIGISARASDVRVAQQLGTLSSLPTARGRGPRILQRVHSERHPRSAVRIDPARG